MTSPLCWGVALSIVLGWLTLRARSVWPAAACAAVSQILAAASPSIARSSSPREYLFPTVLAVWAIVALVLVRYLFFVQRDRRAALERQRLSIKQH
jgi:hypothetical protein